MIRKTIAFVVTLVAAGFAGYAIAWNSQLVTDWVASVGGIYGFLLGVSDIAVMALAVFWPDSWNKLLHRAAIVAALTVAVLGASQLSSTLTGTPWATLGIILCAILVVTALWALTIMDEPLRKTRAWLTTFSAGRKSDRERPSVLPSREHFGPQSQPVPPPGGGVPAPASNFPPPGYPSPRTP